MRKRSLFVFLAVTFTQIAQAQYIEHSWLVAGEPRRCTEEAAINEYTANAYALGYTLVPKGSYIIQPGTDTCGAFDAWKQADFKNPSGAKIGTGQINYKLAPPPPSCGDKQGQIFTPPAFVEGWEGKDDDDCYYYCALYIDGNSSGALRCEYTGQTANDADEDGDLDNFDTDVPEYCNHHNPDGSCADFNHPDNEGGCSSNGRTYGEADLGAGTVQGCFSATPDYEPDEPLDTDGDGTPDSLDNDIDNDGIPNSQDADIDGNGNNNAADTDGDGIADHSDGDIDGDGIPNGSDTDADGDGIANGDDPSPNGAGGGGGNSNCVGDQCNGNGEEEAPGSGTATDCKTPPSSEGDPQLAAIHRQLWINACEQGALGETADYYESDDDGRTWDSVMSGFGTRINNSAVYTGVSSFFDVSLSGSCPIYSVESWAFNITFDQWCDEAMPWGLIGGILITVSTLVAVRVALT